MSVRGLDLREAVEHALRHGEKIGAYQVEALACRVKEVLLRVMKAIPSVSTNYTSGLAVRVTTRNNVGFAFTTSLRLSFIEDAVEKALANAKAKGRDEYFRSLPPPMETPELEVKPDEHISAITKADLLNYYGTMKDIVEGSGKKVALVGGGMWAVDGAFVLANSLGISFEARRTIFSASAFGLARDEIPPAEGWESIVTDKLDEFSPEEMAEKVVEEVCDFKRAKEVELKGDLDLVFRPEAVSDMMWILTEAFRADNVDRGATPFGRDKIGQQVASEALSIFDDPRSPENPARASRDMEGVPTRRVALIERGVLKEHLTDYYYALKWGVQPTGSCTRPWPRLVGAAPSVDHLFLQIRGKEEAPLEELIGDVKKGFLIRDVMGVHQSDFRSGRFSLPASGWLIEDGEVRKPVLRLMISGTMPELLNKVDLVSKERKKFFGLTRGNFPALRARGVHVVAMKSPLRHRISMRIANLLARLGIIKVI
ncbi:hypothetical protein B6U66_03715 [Candidatus Bathyarchaeota archaeon ex4484_135]|nr:MAG: hypothetical protein B6U66_03715 [Candidatus Bathyarchaeota archaeon ex4484_135]